MVRASESQTTFGEMECYSLTGKMAFCHCRIWPPQGDCSSAFGLRANLFVAGVERKLLVCLEPYSPCCPLDTCSSWLQRMGKLRAGIRGVFIERNCRTREARVIEFAVRIKAFCVIWSLGPGLLNFSVTKTAVRWVLFDPWGKTVDSNTDFEVKGNRVPEVKFIEYDGKRVLLMDFADIVSVGLLSKLIDESIQLVHAVNAPRSVLALMDLSNTRIDREVIVSLKRLSRSNGPYMKAITFVGLGAIWPHIISILLRVTKRRNHKVMRGRSEALDWLVHQ